MASNFRVEPRVLPDLPRGGHDRRETSPLRPSSGDARGRSSSRRAGTPPSANALDDFSRSCRREASVRRRSAASALDAALRALDLAEGEIAQAREHVETAKAATVKGMTPRTSTGASPASRRTTTIEPRNPLEEAAWRGIDTASEIPRIELRL